MGHFLVEIMRIPGQLSAEINKMAFSGIPAAEQIQHLAH
jgi:hypothetical protein